MFCPLPPCSDGQYKTQIMILLIPVSLIERLTGAECPFFNYLQTFEFNFIETFSNMRGYTEVFIQYLINLFESFKLVGKISI